jgi:hypothetical protein
VTKELMAAQGIVKQAAQDSAEKLKNHIIAQKTYAILAQEVEAKERIITINETFKKLVATLKGAQQHN